MSSFLYLPCYKCNLNQCHLSSGLYSIFLTNFSFLYLPLYWFSTFYSEWFVKTSSFKSLNDFLLYLKLHSSYLSWHTMPCLVWPPIISPTFFFIPLHSDCCSLCSSPLILQTLSCFGASGFTSSISVLSMAGFLSRLAPSLTISFSLNTTSSVVNTFFKHSIWICYFLLFFGFVLCFFLDLDLFSEFFSLIICSHSAAFHTPPQLLPHIYPQTPNGEAYEGQKFVCFFSSWTYSTCHRWHAVDAQ